MNPLSDTLRERLSRRGCTAKVDCGALGILTVESLSPRDIAALDLENARAVFYAACRELQQAGEELRQEGKVFQPDEIMQFISGREADAAAQAVLELSGLRESKISEKSDISKKPDALGEPNISKEPDAAEKSNIPEEPDTPEEPDVPKKRHAFVQIPLKNFWKIKRAFAQKTEAQSEKFRLESVRIFEEDFPKFQPESVQAPFLETPEKIKQDGSIERVSREFSGKSEHEIQTQNDRKLPTSPLQDVVGKGIKIGQILPSVENQNSRSEHKTMPKILGCPHEIPSESDGLPDMELHETKSETPGYLHEILSESDGLPDMELHETKSEMPGYSHEIPSESDGLPDMELHETKSETPGYLHEILTESDGLPDVELRETKSETPGYLHEILSESDGLPDVELHETKSETPGYLHEIPSESSEVFETAAQETLSNSAKFTSQEAERFAQILLEGLRRAAVVR